ncbi:MAG TPA: type II toxin-antitoxin system RelE/ParE family toxin [Candidatus Omnitrophota bacterium]|nr:type II toxin-antitoxin system RelE/ParE family toxin [Candidatus Omnitrophota bacterium]
MLEILYYPEGSSGPVRDYLTELARERPKAFARLALDLEILGAEGLRSRQISIRPLGDKLWELKRLYEGIQYRLFFGVGKGTVWLLHTIEKKSAKTPKDDLELAKRRLKEVMNR